MSFELLKLDEFKTGRGRQPEATIVFTKKGSIFVNALAAKMLGIDKPCYLKVLLKDAQIAVYADSRPANGLPLRAEKESKSGVRYIGMCIGMINHLIPKLDWPLSDAQLKKIIYKIGTALEFEEHGVEDAKVYLLE